MNYSKVAFLSFTLLISCKCLQAQTTAIKKLNELGLRPIQTAVPFLNISPNAKASGMGDQGVATEPDEYSAYWNPGKLALLEKKGGFAVSYNPWLAKLVNDMSLVNVSGYYKLRKEDAIGASLTYFNLGTIQFTDIGNNSLGEFRPYEFAFTGTYSRLLSKTFSAGISIKYIESNLSGDISNSSSPSKPARAVAADLGFYYKKGIVIAENDYDLKIGLSISNIGNKVTYSTNARTDFIPTIIRVGSLITRELDDYNKFSLGLEFSKLMTPSQQYDATGNLYTPQKGLFPGIFGSFSDAPGGFSEEMKEIMISLGAEYWYDNIFAARVGYFYENPSKGNRTYLTFGLGLRYNVVGLDFSYIIPTVTDLPLANTLRTSLSFNFDQGKKQESVAE
jgi:hypothetical protein